MFVHQKRLPVVVAISLVGTFLFAPRLVHAATTYQPTWASVDKHTASPEWFKDAKLGIYFHWGPYSVPAFYKEWYGFELYNKGGSHGVYQNNLDKYGDPFSDWPFEKFITGGNDKKGNWTQFAPKLKSAGGNFDPDEWAQLFQDAGAKFAGPVAMHHDGFANWDSKINEWNAVKLGPKLDLAQLFATAIRAKGMKYIMTMHNAMHSYSSGGYWRYAPQQSTTTLKKYYSQLPQAQEDTIWLQELKEIVDQYKPDIIWHDWKMPHVPEWARLQFLAYYFNAAVDWNKEVVTTWKEYESGFNTNGEVADYERGGPADIVNPYWLTDDAMSGTTWSYVTGMKYYTAQQVLHAFFDRVSKNGNLLFDICPMADGTIPQEQKDVLLGLGNWLKKFGESIYSTRAWTVYGEGPMKMGGGSFTAPTAGTSSDFRFTKSKDGNTLYAIELGWPGNSAKVTISSITSARFAATGVYLLDTNAKTSIKMNSFTQNAQGLTFTTPASQPYTALAYAFKITSANSTITKISSAAPAVRPITPIQGKLVCGQLLRGEFLHIPENARGMEIYSIQGKKLFQCRFDKGTANVKAFDTFRNRVSSEMLYVNYVNK